jgi:hypothetical protein
MQNVDGLKRSQNIITFQKWGEKNYSEKIVLTFPSSRKY